MSDLSPKQLAFVREYPIDLNATQAAIRAGYAKGSATVTGCRLLANANIQAALSESLARRSERTEITQDMVLRELASIAFADIGDAIRVDAEGRVFVRDLTTITRDARRAIGEITQHTTEVVLRGEGGEARELEKVRTGIKHHSKVKALELLMRHLGMGVQKLELSGKDGGAIEVAGRDPSTMSAAEIAREARAIAAKLQGEHRNALASGDRKESEHE